MTRNQELWGIVIWVDQEYGDDAHAFIDREIERLAGDAKGIALWREVQSRLSLLRSGPVPIHGQSGAGLH